MELQNIHKKVLAYCAHDDMGLWAILRYVRKEAKEAYASDPTPDWVRQRTIDVIKNLLQSKLVEAGNPNGPKFRTISSSVDETIAFIQREWDLLGKNPNIGDVCWFRATPEGKKVAYDLNLEA